MFERCDFAIAFYYYQDSLFDVSIHLVHKYDSIDIARKEELIYLEAPLNSSILSKTLEEGSQIKKLTFLYTNDDFIIKYPLFHILFSANTLTIDCSKINKNDNHLEYLQILFELWSGFILRLKNLKYWNNKYWDLDFIQKLLSYCGRSPPCWKLSFSKVVIHIDIDNYYSLNFIESSENVSKLKHLIDSLSKIYDVYLENISYEDLFINRTDYFKQCIRRRRDRYYKAKLEFERIWKNWKIPWWFLKNTNDGYNQTIEELKLKEFEFYKDKIGLKRYY